MYEYVPAELKKLRQWVCFNLIDDGEDKDGRPRKKKVPVCAGSNKFASSTDDTTWDTFEAACAKAARGQCSGIGIVFANGVCGVDIDHCVDDGELDETARDIVAELCSYTELSPSGTGVHILCMGKLPREGRRRGAVEMYDGGRFFTVTGQAIRDESGQLYGLRECTADLAKVHAKYVAPEPQPESAPAPVRQSPAPAEGALRNLTDAEIFEIAFQSKGGEQLANLYAGDWSHLTGKDTSHSAADLALCNQLAFWFACDKERMDAAFRLSGLYRPKWDKRNAGSTYGERTLERAIRDCREVFRPVDRPRKRTATLPLAPPLPDAPPDAPPEPVATPAKATAIPVKIIERNPSLYTLDDTGNAYRFRDAYHNDVKFDHVNGCWYIWDGARWKVDDTGHVKRMANELLLEMQREADKWDVAANGPNPLTKHVRASRSSKAKEAMLREVQPMPGIPVTPGEFDLYTNAICLKNGVVTLKTGEIKPHRREYKMSLQAGVGYDAKARCPRWLRFLEDVTAGDKELQHFLQLMAGYCLTGSTREQCVFFLYGHGSNGKSVFLHTLSALLGDYARNAQPETVMLRDKAGNNAARSDIARLKGTRLVTTFEPNSGCKIDEGMVKQLSGEDNVTARFLYKAEFEFKPTFKIIMATNYKPIISGKDDGIWRRVRLVPFTVTVPPERRDVNLEEKLRAELPGILNWALRGAVEWYRHGLPKCAAVDAAVQEYRTEMDKVQQFVDDCIDARPGCSLQAKAVYDVYRAWCEDEGERYPLGGSKFYGELKTKFEHHKTKQYNEYLDIDFTDRGVRLQSEAELKRRERY